MPGPGLCVLGQQTAVKCSAPSFPSASVQALLGHGDKAARRPLTPVCIEVHPPGASGGPGCLHTPALGHDLGPTGHQTSREEAGPLRIHPYHLVP